jgi:hypothetical protein
MKPQAGQSQIVQRLGLMNGIENLQRPLEQIRADFRGAPFLEQFSQAFIRECPDHKRTFAPIRSFARSSGDL